MPEPTPALEVERVMNLVRGFGWEQTAMLIEDDKVILTIEKKMPIKTTPEPT